MSRILTAAFLNIYKGNVHQRAKPLYPTLPSTLALHCVLGKNSNKTQ